MPQLNDIRVIDMMKRPVDSLKVSEMEPKNTSEDQTVTNIPTRNGPGLLDLPPEIRYLIYRHLLLHHDLSQLWWHSVPQNYLAVLKTNRLINREASSVFYQENTFADCFWSSYFRMALPPGVIDMLQNVQLTLFVDGTEEAAKPFKEDTVATFWKFIKRFGNQSIVRNTLAVTLWVDRFAMPAMPAMPWFTSRLGRFTNFRTIELSFRDSRVPPSDITNIREYVQTALEPMLGHAEEFENDGFEVKCLRFHPLDFSRAQNASQELGPGAK